MGGDCSGTWESTDPEPSQKRKTLLVLGEKCESQGKEGSSKNNNEREKRGMETRNGGIGGWVKKGGAQKPSNVKGGKAV